MNGKIGLRRKHIAAVPTGPRVLREVISANGQPGDVLTYYVHALRAERNSGRNGPIIKESTRHNMLECPLFAHSCSLDDLIQFNETVCRTLEDSGLMTR